MENLKISLAAARVNANLTQEDTARTMHVSKRTVVNWEKGRVTPTLATVQALANLYGIPIDNIGVSKK